MDSQHHRQFRMPIKFTRTKLVKKNSAIVTATRLIGGPTKYLSILILSLLRYLLFDASAKGSGRNCGMVLGRETNGSSVVEMLLLSSSTFNEVRAAITA
jgi:hypothetical protein